MIINNKMPLRVIMVDAGRHLVRTPGNVAGVGVPWVQIMESALECLCDRRGHDGHLAKKILKKDYS